MTAAGGTVVAPPFDVGDQGRMAVFADPAGAFFSAWQSRSMRGFATQAPNTFGWAELNARGVEKAIPFYTGVFGWSHKVSPVGEGSPDVQRVPGRRREHRRARGRSTRACPAEVPSYWTIYFNVDDVDDAFRRAIDLGATEVVAPAGDPGRPVRDPDRPAGRGVRAHQGRRPAGVTDRARAATAAS